MNAVIHIDAGRAVIGLQQFRLALAERSELMKVLGAAQLESVYKTFDEEGPGWAPLSAASLSWNKKYTAAHKLLQNTGLGRKSITVASDNSTATLGTNLWYMRLQQEGFDGTQKVGSYSYTRHTTSRDTFGRLVITNKLGRGQTVRRKLSSGIATVTVRGFSRRITIPPRPFLVFRPEDPQRIEGEVKSFVENAARESGLEAN
jgi:phage gpG-like protein